MSEWEEGKRVYPPTHPTSSSAFSPVSLHTFISLFEVYFMYIRHPPTHFFSL